MITFQATKELATSVAAQALAIATADRIDPDAIVLLQEQAAMLASWTEALTPAPALPVLTVPERINEYVEHLNNHPKSVSALVNIAGEMWHRSAYHADKPGAKYTRIVRTQQTRTDAGNWVDGQHFVHCFVENTTGLVYKSAGWKAPAKGARFDLMDDTSRADLFARSTFSGGGVLPMTTLQVLGIVAMHFGGTVRK